MQPRDDEREGLGLHTGHRRIDGDELDGCTAETRRQLPENVIGGQRGSGEQCLDAVVGGGQQGGTVSPALLE